MKVLIYETVYVEDPQRIQIADLIDGKHSKRKATSAELKAYIWDLGSDWQRLVKDMWDLTFGEPAPAADDSLDFI